MKKIILSAAITGARPPKEGETTRPFTPEQIAEEIIRCGKAGAAICHIHAHDKTGAPSHDIQDWADIDRVVRSELKKAGVDMVLNYTTSCGNDEERMAHIRKFKPEVASYDAGTINWIDNRVFMNSPTLLMELGKCLTENDVRPEIEIFDTNMIKWALRMADMGCLKEPFWFQLVLGTFGGMDATVENLVILRSKLPKDAKWSVTGIGPGSVPMMMAALAMGCDGIRVGMEDNTYMAKGIPATNVLQVERAKEIIRLANYDIASPAEAREILSLRKPD